MCSSYTIVLQLRSNTRRQVGRDNSTHSRDLFQQVCKPPPPFLVVVDGTEPSAEVGMGTEGERQGGLGDVPVAVHILTQQCNLLHTLHNERPLFSDTTVLPYSAKLSRSIVSVLIPNTMKFFSFKVSFYLQVTQAKGRLSKQITRPGLIAS